MPDLSPSEGPDHDDAHPPHFIPIPNPITMAAPTAAPDPRTPSSPGNPEIAP